MTGTWILKPAGPAGRGSSQDRSWAWPRARRGMTGLATVLAAAAGLALANPAAGDDTELSIAIGIDPDTLDPVENDNTLVSNLQDFVCETLVYQDAEGEAHPLLATDWDVSEDGRTWTFELREDVAFHDGTDFDAEAAAFNINRLVDPDTRVPLRGWMGPLAGAEAVGEHTLRVDLDEPFAPFIRAMSLTIAAMNSPAAVDDLGDRYRMSPVCTGQFEVVDWRRGDNITLQRYADYWGEPSSFEAIRIPIVPEAGTRMSMVLAQDVDIAVLPPAPDVPQLEANPDVTVYSEPSSRIMFFAMNTTWGPFQDQRVRQAMNHAIDGQILIERILYEQASPVTAPIPDFFFGHSDIGTYDYDPDRARALLEEAGYPDGFELTLSHPTGRYLLDAQVSEAAQAMLSEVGIDVSLRTMDWPSYTDTIYEPQEESDIQMYMLGWGPWILDAHMTLFPHFHSSQSSPTNINATFYDNPEVDELLERGAVEQDTEARREIYREAMEIIWEEAPWVFLYVQNYVIATRADLEGLQMLPIEKFDIRDARIE